MPADGSNRGWVYTWPMDTAFLPRLIVALLGLTGALFPARADDAIRAEIDAALKQMAAAVLAGDAAAYLEHISTGDPWFRQEQVAWAAQLGRYTPAVFTLNVGDGPAKFEGTLAEFPLVMAWRIDTGPETSWGAGGQERWVKFPPVTFRKRDGRWQYCGERWEYKRGPNFIVRYLPGSEAVVDDVLQAFPISKKHVDEFFGIDNRDPQIIALFQSMDHLKATVYLNMPDHNLGGWNEPGESIKFMHNYTRGVEGWKYAFAHEYGHVATWFLGEHGAQTPWWISEGIAERAAEKYIAGRWRQVDRQIRRLAQQGGLPEFEQLSDYLTTEPHLKSLAYTQGHHMIAFIDTTWDAQKRNDFVRAVVQGRSVDEASRTVLGIAFEELDRRWRDSILASPEPAVPQEPEPKPQPTAAAGADQDEQVDELRPDPEELRAQLQDVLRRIEASVAAVDEAGFLDAMDLADPVFATEQRAWFKDLHRKPTERFAMTLENNPELRRDGTAAARVRSSWRMPGAEERFVILPTRFVRSDTGWLYSGEDWSVKEADRIRVMYIGRGLDDMADKVIEILPDIRDHVLQGFELSDDPNITQRIQEVKLYPTMKHLQYSIYPSYEDALGGWNEPGESIKLLATAGMGPRYLSTVLGHEYGHVATFELGPHSNDIPWWIMEGVAELAASRFAASSRRVDQTVRAWAASDNLVEWERLGDFYGEAATLSTYVYTQGHHMMMYISERFGRTGRNDWLRAMAKGAGLDDATRDVFGISFEQLDRDWRASLREPERQPPRRREPVGATPRDE
jgi:hypothetical protein